jgi:hypothetical protein
MAQGLIQPLKETNTRKFLGGRGGSKSGPARKADILTATREPFVQKMWDPRRLTALYTSKACFPNSNKDSGKFIFQVIGDHGFS